MVIQTVGVGEEHTSAINHINTQQPTQKQSSNWLACLQQWAGSGWQSLRSLLLQNTQEITSSDRIAIVELSQVWWYWFQGMARLQTIYKIQQTKVIPIVPQTSIQNTNGKKPSQASNQSLIPMSLRTPYFTLSVTTTLVNWGQFCTTENLQASKPFIYKWVHISIKYRNI